MERSLILDTMERQAEINARWERKLTSLHGVSDLVDTYRAHALIIDLPVEPAYLETRKIIHEESIDAHSIEGAHIASEQGASLIVRQIEWGESLHWSGLHRSTEDMVAQNLATKMVDREDGHRHLRSGGSDQLCANPPQPDCPFTCLDSFSDTNH